MSICPTSRPRWPGIDEGQGRCACPGDSVKGRGTSRAERFHLKLPSCLGKGQPVKCVFPLSSLIRKLVTMEVEASMGVGWESLS